MKGGRGVIDYCFAGQPLMRPTKRQLSEKDIIVGPNGEIKRRKRLRNLKGKEIITK